MTNGRNTQRCSWGIAAALVLTGAGVAAAQSRAPVAVPLDGAMHGAQLPGSGAPEGGTILDGSGPGMQAAADHIITYQCLDGGWGWPHTGCPTTTFANITGPIGLGLLRIWEVTGDAATLAAAKDGGDFDLTSVYPNLTPAFGSFSPGFLHAVTLATSDSAYSTHAETGFFDALTAGTYGDPGVSAFFPADTYDYIARHKSLRSGSLINLRPWDMQLMPWVAGLIGNADSMTPLDGISQSDTFRDDSVLDGLDTLDEGVQYDLLGLAGGIRGLALNGTTTFPAISAPLFGDIDTLTDLCDLADVLVSFQNTDGSWSWVSSLQNPVDPTDKDTQTTAYAVLALVAAQDAGCTGAYNSEIAMGRTFLDSMQDGTGGFASYPTGAHNIEAEAEAAWAATVSAVTLSTSACSPGTVTVSINMASMPDAIVGGQFFLDYDDSILTFVSADPGGSPFTVQVFELTGAGTIAYAVGVSGGGPGTMAASTMATLTFTASEVCTPTADLVTWNRPHLPPSRLTNDVGDSILPTLIDLGPMTVDHTDPLITPPSDITVNADAGGCDAAVTVPALVASDACTGVDSIINNFNFTSNASGLYPPGTTTVTWTVTDNCGNDSVETQDITVDGFNDLSVDVQLQSVSEASVTRCITFELFKCPGTVADAVVEAELEFLSGTFTGTVEVPCGDYECITARDTLHTLQRTDSNTGSGGDFTIVGAEYVADFTTSGTTDDSLIGGNLNDDAYIDILDFGIFVGQYLDVLGGDTLCSTTGPHADISGDGIVGTEDFTFIGINFLKANETGCCVVLMAHGPRGITAQAAAAGPVTRISRAELVQRGMGDLVVADLNKDGWLDVLDMMAFLGGALP